MDMDRIQFPLRGKERRGKEWRREERRGEVFLDHAQSVHSSSKTYPLTSDVNKNQCVCVCVCVRGRRRQKCGKQKREKKKKAGKKDGVFICFFFK